MGFYLGRLEATESIQRKLRQKHGITLEQVREALEYPAEARAVFDESLEHGPRVIAVGRHGSGLQVIAYLMPRPPLDWGTDTWAIRTARWLRR